MDALQVEKVILAGHSLAGVELNHFAGTCPNRLLKLIYLDAPEDYGWYPEIQTQDPLKDFPPPISEKKQTTVEEFISNLKLKYPSFADIWTDLWDREISYEVTQNEKGVVVGKMPGGIARQMMEAATSYTAMQTPSHIPILRFFAFGFARPCEAYSEEQKAAACQYYQNVRLPHLKSMVTDFHHWYPHARIVEIPDGHHYCFTAQEDLVYEEMRKFLLD